MTKDTTTTPAGRERADSEPEWPRLVIADDFANNPTLWLERHEGDSQPRPIIGEYEARDAWPLLVAAITDAERLTAERDAARSLLGDMTTLMKARTAERDEARAALAALRGDVEALAERVRDGWFETADDLAAVLANHPTTKKARCGSREAHAAHSMPCDSGCQPDWHRDDCAIYGDCPGLNTNHPTTKEADRG